MQGEQKAVNEFVDLIKEIIHQELDKTDSTVLCQIKNKKSSDHYDVIIVPDTKNIVKNVVNMTKFDLEEGDYVYVYKINNQLSNCFIVYKLMPFYENYEIPNQSSNTGDTNVTIYNNTYEGSEIDISVLENKGNTHIADGTIHVTSQDKDNWNDKVEANVNAETLKLEK